MHVCVYVYVVCLFLFLPCSLATQLICKTSAGNISCHPLSESRQPRPCPQLVNQPISAPSHTRIHTNARTCTWESFAHSVERWKKWLHYNFQFCFIIFFALLLFVCAYVCVCACVCASFCLFPLQCYFYYYYYFAKLLCHFLLLFFFFFLPFTI